MNSVFLAEDEPWALITLKKLINWQENGFYISGEAGDGESAWKRISCTHPDLLIADIRMPGMNGLELLKNIRGEKLRTEVIFISGYSEFSYAQEAIAYGCLGYLIKPVDRDELLRYLEKARRSIGGEQEEGLEDAYLSENLLVRKVLAYIGEHYSEKISLQKIAGEFQMSESYVSNLIKRNTGKSYNTHILEARIRKAQEMLRHTNKSIEEIALRVGYSDYFYFTKVYKKATGVTPAVYRKNL